MRCKCDVTTLFSQWCLQESWAQLNCCEWFIVNLWRQHLNHICIRRKYEPGFRLHAKSSPIFCTTRLLCKIMCKDVVPLHWRKQSGRTTSWTSHVHTVEAYHRRSHTDHNEAISAGIENIPLSRRDLRFESIQSTAVVIINNNKQINDWFQSIEFELPVSFKTLDNIGNYSK